MNVRQALFVSVAASSIAAVILFASFVTGNTPTALAGPCSAAPDLCHSTWKQYFGSQWTRMAAFSSCGGHRVICVLLVRPFAPPY